MKESDKREYPRFDVKFPLEVTDKSFLNGEIVDMSLNGVRIKVAGNLELEEIKVLENKILKLFFKYKEKIIDNIEAKVIRINSDSAGNYISLKFVELPTQLIAKIFSLFFHQTLS
jgi:hypothetical protein